MGGRVDLAAWRARREGGRAAQNACAGCAGAAQTLRMMVEGRANKEIAAALDVARTTVSTYRNRILEKFGVEDLPSLVRLVARIDQQT